MPWSPLHNAGSCFLRQDGCCARLYHVWGWLDPCVRVGEVGRPVYLCLGLLSSGVRKVAGSDGLAPHRPTCVSVSHFPVSRQLIASEIVSLSEESTPMTLSSCRVSRPPWSLYHFIPWNRSSYLMAALWGPIILNANKFYQNNKSLKTTTAKVKIEHPQSEISSVPIPKTSWEGLNFGFWNF